MANSKIRFYSADDFLAKEFPRELFLCTPIIPLGGNVLIHGKRAIGKSAFALTMAEAITTGGTFLNHYPCAKGPVVYIQIDMPAKLQQMRMKKVALATKDLHIITADGGMDIIKEATIPRDWTDWIREIDPILVIVDTLRRCHKLKENESDTPIKVLLAWRKVIGEHATLALLHHDRKSFENEDKDEAARGSGAWLDEIDTGIHLLGRKKKLNRMEFSKLRTCEYPDDPIKLWLNSETMLVESGQLTLNDWIEIQMAEGTPREDIIQGATDPAKWKKAMPLRTIQHRLKGYQTT